MDVSQHYPLYVEANDPSALLGAKGLQEHTTAGPAAAILNATMTDWIRFTKSLSHGESVHGSQGKRIRRPDLNIPASRRIFPVFLCSVLIRTAFLQWVALLEMDLFTDWRSSG